MTCCLVLLYLSWAMTNRFFAYAKTKAQISFSVTAKLISTLVFTTHTDSTIPLLLKYEISSVYPSSEATQACLCQTWSETPKTEQQLLGRNHYCRELIRLAQGHNMVPHEGIEPPTSRFRGRCPPGHHSFISWRINVSCSRTQLKPVLPNCGCL